MKTKIEIKFTSSNNDPGINLLVYLQLIFLFLISNTFIVITNCKPLFVTKIFSTKALEYKKTFSTTFLLIS